MTDHNLHREKGQDYLSASMFAFAVAVVHLVFYCLVKFRFGYADAPFLAEATGLSCGVLFFPSLAGKWLGSSKLGRHGILTSHAFLTLVTLAGILLLAYIPGVVAILAPLGFISAALMVVRYFKEVKPANAAKVLLPAVGLGIFLSAHIFARRNHLPFFMDYLIIGKTHIDALFHAAIANIIKNYNFPSTGLSGIPLLNYHFGSHWVFAQFSRLLQTPMLSTYLIVYPLVLVPFFIKSFLTAVLSLQNIIAVTNPDVKPEKAATWLWPAVAIALVGILPNAAQSKILLNMHFAFGSQSYTFALTLLWLLVAMVCEVPQIIKKNASLSAIDKAVLLVLFPLLWAAVGLSKISVGLVSFFTVAYLALRYFKRLNIYVYLSLVVSLAGIYFVYGVSNSSAGDLVIEPFSFFNEVIGSTKPFAPFFFIFYYGWTFFYTLWVLLAEDKGDWKALFRNAVEGKRPFLELLWAMAFISLVPINLVYIAARSDFYFADVQPWWALLVVFASLPVIVESDVVKKAFATLMQRHVLKPLVAVLVLASSWVVIDCVRTNEKELSLMSADVARESQNPSPETQKRLSLLRQFKVLADQPVAEKRQTLVFIPKAVTGFWEMLDKKDNKYPCQTPSYIFPALTGMAMIDGLPEPSCPFESIHFESSYHQPTHAQTLAETTPEYLCAKAKKLGFSKLVFLKETKDDFKLENHACNPL